MDLNDFQKEVLKELKEGTSMNEIADKYGRSAYIISKMVNKLIAEGFITKEEIEEAKDIRNGTQHEQEIVLNALLQGKGQAEIYNETGISRSRIATLKARAIKRGLITEEIIANNREKRNAMLKSFIEEYIKKQYSIKEVAQKLNTSVKMVSILAKEAGLEFPKPQKQKDEVDGTREKLNNKYEKMKTRIHQNNADEYVFVEFIQLCGILIEQGRFKKEELPELEGAIFRASIITPSVIDMMMATYDRFLGKNSESAKKDFLRRVESRIEEKSVTSEHIQEIKKSFKVQHMENYLRRKYQMLIRYMSPEEAVSTLASEHGMLERDMRKICESNIKNKNEQGEPER